MQTIRKSKWTSKEIDTGIIEERGGTVIIDGKSNQSCNELLARSLVGSFPANGSELTEPTGIKEESGNYCILSKALH